MLGFLLIHRTDVFECQARAQLLKLFWVFFISLVLLGSSTTPHGYKGFSTKF